MIGRLRSLFGKSGKEPSAGAPAAQQTAPAGAAVPNSDDAAETERQLTAAVTEAERRGGDGVGLGDALTFLANFLTHHDRSSEAEAPLRRVLAIEEAGAPGRPGRLVRALANLASTCRYLGKRAEA